MTTDQAIREALALSKVVQVGFKPGPEGFPWHAVVLMDFGGERPVEAHGLGLTAARAIENAMDFARRAVANFREQGPSGTPG